MSDQDKFQAVLSQEGLCAALRFLNSRTNCRITAVYRFEGMVMRNIGLYDRLGELHPTLVEVPLEDSFCKLVLRHQRAFVLPDDNNAKAIAGHKYEGVVPTYVGVPLSPGPGQLYGTLCHIDFEPREVPAAEIEFMAQQVGPLLCEAVMRSAAAPGGAD